MPPENFNDLDPNEFDPNDFGPDNAGGPQGKIPSKQPIGGSSVMITLKAVNAGAAALNAEFFAPATGIASMVNDANINAFNAATPNRVVAAVNLNSQFYFDETGALIVQDAAGAKLTLSCVEIPYRQLLNVLLSGSFTINRVRMTVLTDAQIDKQITFRDRTMFGKIAFQDSINPRQYFRADQFQSKIIEIGYNWKFNACRAFTQNILAGETVTYALTINGVRTPCL